jgi:hypothetical protein
MVPKLNALSPKEELFIAEYLIDKNATRSFLAAGYSGGKYPSTGAFRLLNKPHIKAAVDKALKARLKRVLISGDQVLRDIDRLAEVAELRGELGIAMRGKELIGRHHRLFVEKHEHSGPNGSAIPVEITEIRRTVVDPKAPNT